MTSASQLTATRIQDGDHLGADIMEMVCDECQTTCWSVTVTVRGIAAGQGYKTWLFTRGHLEQGRALQVLGRWLLGHGAVIGKRDDEAWLLEHQLSLW